MKVIQLASAVAVLAFASSMACAGEAQQPFSALEGVDAQALSSSEMNAVYGQLTIADIQAAIMADVSNPLLQSFLLKELNFLATMYPNQVSKILTILTHYGL
jgi:hypothetical protein